MKRKGEKQMKRSLWSRAIALVFALLLTGCTTNPPPSESTEPSVSNTPTSSTAPENPTTTDPVHEHDHVAGEVVVATCTSDGYTIYTCECGDTYNDDYTEKVDHTFEETVIAPTTETEGYTLYMCTVCNYAYKDNYTDKVVDDGLTPEQRNSIAMLNYLATLTQEINASRNSRMFLEEAYASLINNTNPEEVNELTESHLCSLLDTIEEYRVIAVKRERLEYLYNQNKAKAIREAIPNPVSVLSAATSLDLKRLVASVAYMAVDSISSYNAYNDELDQAFLQDGWALDDEAATALHESRKYAFLFMIEIVREDNLPGELALNESAVENFVTWTTNDNVVQRLQFLESEEETYRGFGNYWLARAECYYELKDYDNCLEAIEMYKKYQADIFRKDYYFAQIMPKAIAAAAEYYSDEEYISHAEDYLNILVENTESNEWALRFFAAQVYMDLYTKTSKIAYLDKAYDLVLNNVNVLVNEQKELTSAYLADVKEVEIPDDATSDEKKQIKDYNKALKETRKTELPTIYEPLLLNCELLFALIEKVDVSSAERTKIDSILGVNGSNVFLTVPVVNRYASTARNVDVTATFDKASLSVPVSCVSANSEIRVSVTENGKTTVYDDWMVSKVERSGDDFESYVATYTSEKAKDQTWSAESTVMIEILDEEGSGYDPVVIRFKVSKYSKFIWETVKFEQVV